MSIASVGFRVLSTLSDRKRDKDLKVDATICAHYDLTYGKSKKYNSLDIYYPRRTKEKLPVIVNFHGGGFVYGMKKNYMHYGMFMAKQGFVFVNSNYHLAPKKKYPTQLEELNSVLEWMTQHQDKYYMDLSNVFFVGDSVGAQLALQYATIYSNPDFADLFELKVPEGFSLRALALNCGLYSLYSKMEAPQNGNKNDTESQLLILIKDYLGKNWRDYRDQLSVRDYLTEKLPPAFVMTAEYDFLREESLPLVEAMKKSGVNVRYEKYGEPGDKHMEHIFHCNMNLTEAEICNREQTAFFKSMVR
ncbi:MAG: alpha/beta hydrolase [Alkalibacterium sp.]|nr:alpha/beta hydrolase [Alkalibacterium sp.]